MKSFTASSFKIACDSLAKKHSGIRKIITQYGHPPLYQRPFGFSTLVQIILEQQVSLASGRAVFNRLQTYLGEINPYGLAAMNVEQLRSCSVSRQKAGYLHHLSEMVDSGRLTLETLSNLPDEEVRKSLLQVKGIGPWTADVVLMLCMQRTDVFPLGDVALINSMRHQHRKPEWTIPEIEKYALRYAPLRTAAAYCYWHAYINRKNVVV